jgi:hypothetical protein
MASFALIQEICWLRGFMSELGFELEESTRVYMEGKSKCHRFGKQFSASQEFQGQRNNQISLVKTEDQKNGGPAVCSITYATCRHVNQGVS